jgi:hypothetical protein
MLAKLLCWLTPALLWSQSAGGTAGVAIFTPDRAVLAVDSRVTLTDGRASRRGADECKIQSAGRFQLALAGLYDHAETKFDAWRLAEQAAAGAPSVAEAAARVERGLQPALESAIGNMRAADPTAFSRQYARAHLAFVIAGLDQGLPAMAARAFVPDREGNLRIVRWNPPPGTTSLFAFGEHAAIDAYGPKEALLRLVTDAGPAEAAQRLVQLEIAASPEIVGPPVAVLELSKIGPRWIHQALCR